MRSSRPRNGSVSSDPSSKEGSVQKFSGDQPSMWRYSILLQYDPWINLLNLWYKGQFQHFELTGSPTGDGVFCEERSNDPVLCHSTLDTDAGTRFFIFRTIVEIFGIPQSAPVSIHLPTTWRFSESLTRFLCLFICPVKWMLLLWRRQGGSSTNTAQQGSGHAYVFGVGRYILTLITKEKIMAHS
jgi:hypothetical protein